MKDEAFYINEIERLKAEIMRQGDMIVSIGMVLLKPNEREILQAEVDRLTKEKSELLEALAKINIAGKLAIHSGDNAIFGFCEGALIASKSMIDKYQDK